MKRLHQVILTSLLTLLFVVCLAPASLIGAVLRQVSNQQWDMVNATGALWNGHGVFLGKALNDQPPTLLPALDWNFEGLQSGAVSFQLKANGSPMGQALLGLNGWQVKLRDFSMEAKDITPVLPGMLNKGGWQGLLKFRKVHAQGDFTGLQTSQFELEWLHAATSLLQNGQLGNFSVSGQVEKSGQSFSITSQEGPLVITGQGANSAQNGFQFTGKLIDNAGLAAQFPGFLGAYLQATETPGHYALNVTQLKI